MAEQLENTRLLSSADKLALSLPEQSNVYLQDRQLLKEKGLMKKKLKTKVKRAEGRNKVQKVDREGNYSK